MPMTRAQHRCFQPSVFVTIRGLTCHELAQVGVCACFSLESLFFLLVSPAKCQLSPVSKWGSDSGLVSARGYFWV